MLVGESQGSPAWYRGPSAARILYANDPDTYTQGGGSAVFTERGPMDCPTRPRPLRPACKSGPTWPRFRRH